MLLQSIKLENFRQFTDERIDFSTDPERNGIEGVTGILEYPKLRKTEEVVLSDIDRETIVEMSSEIQLIIESETCPPSAKKGICKNCSCFDFCYSGEEEI